MPIQAACDHPVTMIGFIHVPLAINQPNLAAPGSGELHHGEKSDLAGGYGTGWLGGFRCISAMHGGICWREAINDPH